MSEGKSFETWNYFSALIHSVNTMLGGESQPEDFHPMIKKERKVQKTDLKVLKKVFCKGKD